MIGKDFPKVVLIQLPSPWLMRDRDTPLLGVLYLATNLQHEGIEVQVCDLVGVEQENWNIPEGDIYGISLTTPQVPETRQVIKYLRERTKKPITIIVGGPHPSAMPQWCVDKLGADYAFKGEADVALVDFVKNGPPKVGNVIKCIPPIVSKLPAIRRDFVDMRSFHRIGINQYILWKDLKGGFQYEGYLQTGRGCPFDCAFCAQDTITNRSVRFYTVEQVLADLDNLLNYWECDLVYMQDDTFNIKKKRVLELCKAFEERKFKWHCLCRADLLDKEQCDAMAAAGCQNITFGFESGSQKILDLMGKGESVEEGVRGALLTHEAGMGVRGQMVVGFPGEDDDTIKETIAFIARVKAEKLGFHAFVPLPGSRSWDDAAQFGIEIDHNEDFATGFHTIGQPREWKRIVHNEEKTREWLKILYEAAGEHNIWMKHTPEKCL